MQEEITERATSSLQKLYIAPTSHLYGKPEVPSSKYYTLPYLPAATLADGESLVILPAESDDSEALFGGCRAFGGRSEDS